ncbi:hypothetical protein EVAR_30340_1 [Eumeta japonica]|uniref:Uncharacterized protein n=1 Tax=Eumeta variegata TaxID=151549 RepID=A0A4C1W8C2_EUMVA|nr:hypothetical protein EVAR_30340_1 [Eumeta japonica]
MVWMARGDRVVCGAADAAGARCLATGPAPDVAQPWADATVLYEKYELHNKTVVLTRGPMRGQGKGFSLRNCRVSVFKAYVVFARQECARKKKEEYFIRKTNTGLDIWIVCDCYSLKLIILGEMRVVRSMEIRVCDWIVYHMIDRLCDGMIQIREFMFSPNMTCPSILMFGHVRVPETPIAICELTFWNVTRVCGALDFSWISPRGYNGVSLMDKEYMMG